MKLNTKQTYQIINKKLQYAIQSSNQENPNLIEIGPINQNNYRQLWLVQYKDQNSYQIVNGWTDNVLTKDYSSFKLIRGEMNHRQLWTLEASEFEDYYIRYSKSKDRYLCISNGKLILKDVKSQKEADLWVFKQVLNNELLNKSCFIRQKQTKKLIDVPQGSKKSCEKLIIWNQHHRFNQRWNIYKAGQIYVIKSFYNQLNFDIQEQKYEQGTHIIQYESHGNLNQFWRFQKIQGNMYRISSCAIIIINQFQVQAVSIFGKQKDTFLNDHCLIYQQSFLKFNKMNWVLSEQFINQAINNTLANEKCKDLHPNSCNYYAGNSGISAMKSCKKLYFFVHLFQFLLQLKKLKKNPFSLLYKFVIGYCKSMLFVGGSIFMIRRVICLVTEIYQFSTTGILISGFASGLPLLIESKGRQTEISLFCLKEGFDMLYLILKRRYKGIAIKHAEILIFSFAAAIILYQYFQQRQNFRQSYRKILGFIFSNI